MTVRTFMSTLAIFYVDPTIKSIHMTYSLKPLPMVLKFYMQHDQPVGLQKDNIKPFRETKIAAAAKISKPVKSPFSLEQLRRVIVRNLGISYGFPCIRSRGRY